MVVYRICRAIFATDLKASGLAGRWNKDGQWVLYTSTTRSLAALEQLVNRSGLILEARYHVMMIDVPDDETYIRTISPDSLPPGWSRLSGYGRLQDIGADWYRKSESLLLKVPSVLIPQEFNYLIHTRHPAFTTQVRLIGAEDYIWDSRF